MVFKMRFSDFYDHVLEGFFYNQGKMSYKCDNFSSGSLIAACEQKNTNSECDENEGVDKMEKL
jgi:hypothetical protein